MKTVAIFAGLLFASVASAQGYGQSHQGEPKVVLVQQSLFTVSALQKECEAADRVSVAQASNDRSHLKGTDWVESVACISYIQGVMDELVGSTIVENGEIFTVELVEACSMIQAEKLFMQYIQTRPELLSRPAYFAVTLALGEARIVAKQSAGKVAR